MTRYLRYLRHIRSTRNGPQLIRSQDLHGATIEPTELACSCGIAGKRARFGIQTNGGYYAYVILEDGTMADGCYRARRHDQANPRRITSISLS